MPPDVIGFTHHHSPQLAVVTTGDAPGAITGSRLGYSPSVPRAGHHHRRQCPLGSRDGTSPPCPHGCPAWSDAPHTPGHWQCAGWPASCCCQNTCQPVQYTHHYLGHVSLYSTCTTAIWDMRQSSTQYSTHTTTIWDSVSQHSTHTTTIWDTHQLLSVQYTHHCNLGHTSVIQSVQYTHHCNLGHTSVQYTHHHNLGHTSVSPVHTVIHHHNLGHLSVSTVHTPPQFGTQSVQYTCHHHLGSSYNMVSICEFHFSSQNNIATCCSCTL